MIDKALRFVAAAALAAWIASPSLSRPPVIGHGGASELTAHEWGTFTSVAGPDGQGVAWTPLTASPDLPVFIEHLGDEQTKCSLSGTVRMETPVLYFYAPRETSVSVKVSFAKGAITEWYPHASGASRSDTEGSIRWDQVRLMPGATAVPLKSGGESHYYAARNTASTPLRVAAPGGDQDEKFLFYRGVSSAALPLTAAVTLEGQVLVRNPGGGEIPGILWMESRDGKLGYRMRSSLRDEALLDPPPLTATKDAMLADLERMLERRGLYVDEARAMIATWRTSWFEEGSRLLYIVPSQTVNSILPLTISPPPANTVRVFVGRMELVTPATERAVEQAFATGDRTTLEKYGRFLAPIVNMMMAKAATDPERTRMLRRDFDSAYYFACTSSWPAQR